MIDCSESVKWLDVHFTHKYDVWQAFEGRLVVFGALVAVANPT